VSRRYRSEPTRRWSEARTYTDKGGALVHYQTENVGYGFSEYQIVGTFDEVTAATDHILGQYPNNPYGTWFNWPPKTKTGWDGQLVTQREATDLGNELWHVGGRRSNTSD
jgi:hypothetical protein